MHRLALLAMLLPAVVILAADEPKPYPAKVAPASDEPARAVKNIRIPKGMQINLWAAEPDLAKLAV